MGTRAWRSVRLDTMSSGVGAVLASLSARLVIPLIIKVNDIIFADIVH